MRHTISETVDCPGRVRDEPEQEMDSQEPTQIKRPDGRPEGLVERMICDELKPQMPAHFSSIAPPWVVKNAECIAHFTNP